MRCLHSLHLWGVHPTARAHLARELAKACGDHDDWPGNAYHARGQHIHRSQQEHETERDGEYRHHGVVRAAAYFSVSSHRHHTRKML